MLSIFLNKKTISNLRTSNTGFQELKVNKNNICNRNLNKEVLFYPSFNKQWLNTVYCFNKSYTKSLISYDVIVNKLFKSYSNMFINKIKVLFKRRRDNKSRYSANKLYTSRAEIKHMNTKILITLYSYNKQKTSIENNIRKGIPSIIPTNTARPDTKLSGKYENRLSFSLINSFFNVKKWDLVFLRKVDNVIKYLVVKIKKESNSRYNVSWPYFELTTKLFNLQRTLFDAVKLINFNKSLFASLNLNLEGLGIISLISKLYKKKVEIELVELKSVHLNSDIFSEAVYLKLRDRKNKPVTILRKAIQNMVKIPDLHTLITFDDSSETMNNENVINTIKQQIVSGVRFEASGRLTRRLTAMRAVFKYRYTGSLKNIRSSLNNLPSPIFRGHAKSNSQYILINSKTRNGAFGLKTWISSH